MYDRILCVQKRNLKNRLRCSDANDSCKGTCKLINDWVLLLSEEKRDSLQGDHNDLKENIAKVSYLEGNKESPWLGIDTTKSALSVLKRLAWRRVVQRTGTENDACGYNRAASKDSEERSDMAKCIK